MTTRAPTRDLRLSAQQRGYTARWTKARTWYLHRHPLCVECQAHAVITAATVVDHIVPHRGDSELFWREANWQALCQPHHNRKTQAGR